MKLTQVRHFSHASVILTCCCISIAFAATAAAAHFSLLDWIELSPNDAPPARSYLAMTYDSVTQEVVLFGGYDGTNYLGDTWLWDGSTLQWTQATPKHHPTAVTGPMLSRSEWQCRSFWWVRRSILSAYHVAVGRLRLDAIISTNCSVCSGFSGSCNEYFHGTGCHVWRSR